MSPTRTPFSPRMGGRISPMEQNQLREQGLAQELREIQQMAERRIFASRAAQRRNQLMERQRFEEQQEEKNVADLALREGKMSIWMEYKQQKEQAQRLAEIDEFKDMYTHVELEKHLQTIYKKQHALKLARWVHEQIMAHPETLKLLESKMPFRTMGTQMFIQPKAKDWAVWSGQHRLQLLDMIRQNQGNIGRIQTAYGRWRAKTKPMPKPGRMGATASLGRYASRVRARLPQLEKAMR